MVGIAGATLAGATGSLFGLAVPAAIVGAVNGVVSGHRRVYAWRTPAGVGAFVLDSTWTLATTSAAVVSHGVGALRGDPGFAAALSERQNRHVYARGMTLRRGFAITYGNSVNGAGDTSNPRRAKLVTDHENVHVWQARWLGPVYPVLYGGWMVGGAVAGVFIWLTRRGRSTGEWSGGERSGGERSGGEGSGGEGSSLGKTIESCAYYLNPLEWWAYSRDDQWPPSGKVAGLGPAKPIVRSFASYRGKSRVA